MRDGIEKVFREMRPYVLTEKEQEFLETKERLDEAAAEQFRRAAIPRIILDSMQRDPARDLLR